MSFKDLSLTSVIDKIKQDTKDMYSIYVFKNEISNDSQDLYISSSINISSRFSQHMNNINSNIHLHNAMNKYGKNYFSFNVLEEYIYDKTISKEENGLLLIVLEQYYLDLLNPNYNINPTAGKSRVGAKHSEESKELIKLANTGKLNPFYGKTHTEEVKTLLKERMSRSKNPMAGKPVTEIVKQAIKDAHNRPTYLYDSESKELVQFFTSRKEFIKEYKVSSKTIVKYLDSGKVWRDKYLITSKPIF